MSGQTHRGVVNLPTMPLAVGRLLGAAVLVAALAVSRPCAAADPEPPQRIRAGLEILGFLAVDNALLYVSAPPAADPPGNVRLLDKLTLKAWSFDASSFTTNFAAHPLAGTFYYTTARSNRIAPLESLGWASTASLLWELAEFPENVSFNDLIVTPVAGTSLGEPLVQLSQWLDRGHPSGARHFLAAVLFPMKLVNGGPPPDDSDSGALAADLSIVSGSKLGSGPELGVHVASRLVHFPGFGDPGDGTRIGFDGNVSGLSLDARGGRSGLADLRFAAGTSLASLYQRSFGITGEGWDLLASGGVSYDFRQHAWNGGPLDSWSSVHVPGVGFQLRRVQGPFLVSLRADLALTFGGASSFALDGAPATLPTETLTTTQRAWGYTMGWGISAAPRLDISYGPLSLDLAAAIDTRYSLNRPDPWVDRQPTADLSDSWSTVRGGLNLKLPWNQLQISASLERNLRRGSAGSASRTVGETVALIGLGFALQ